MWVLTPYVYFLVTILHCRTKITQSPTFTIPLAQISEVINTRKDQTIRIESSDCEVITLERRLDEHMIWNSTIIEVSTSSY